MSLIIENPCGLLQQVYVKVGFEYCNDLCVGYDAIFRHIHQSRRNRERTEDDILKIRNYSNTISLVIGSPQCPDEVVIHWFQVFRLT